MKIGIIECGKNREEWMEHGAFGTWFPPLLELAETELTYDVYNAMDGDLPGDVRSCDAWLLTGSPASAYDDTPWQKDLSDFLDQVIAQDVPIIGICYGHQHLHHQLGGKVEPGADWGVGVHQYDVTEAPDWMSPELAEQSRDGFELVALHKDQVTQVAPDTTVLAQSAFCPVAASTIGKNILTFQAHPEMDPDFAAKVYEFERHRIGDAGTDEGLGTLGRDRDSALAAKWIMAFLNSRIRP